MKMRSSLPSLLRTSCTLIKGWLSFTKSTFCQLCANSSDSAMPEKKGERKKEGEREKRRKQTNELLKKVPCVFFTDLFPFHFPAAFTVWPQESRTLDLQQLFAALALDGHVDGANDGLALVDGQLKQRLFALRYGVPVRGRKKKHKEARQWKNQGKREVSKRRPKLRKKHKKIKKYGTKF
jgi:hypothetical protein